MASVRKSVGEKEEVVTRGQTDKATQKECTPGDEVWQFSQCWETGLGVGIEMPIRPD
jgi:hypothetical protein